MNDLIHSEEEPLPRLIREDEPGGIRVIGRFKKVCWKKFPTRNQIVQSIIKQHASTDSGNSQRRGRPAKRDSVYIEVWARIQLLRCRCIGLSLDKICTSLSAKPRNLFAGVAMWSAPEWKRKWLKGKQMMPADHWLHVHPRVRRDYARMMSISACEYIKRTDKAVYDRMRRRLK